MSQPDSGLAEPSPRGVIVQKPKTNIYTVMLIVSLVAMIMACVFLYLEIGEYGGFGS
ncbi:MAG: hypothetical protein AAGF31_09585 [Planctomycetota bacterium]